MTLDKRKYALSVVQQTVTWKDGISIHNVYANECCPDFSCCKPEMKMPDADRTSLAAKIINEQMRSLNDPADSGEARQDAGRQAELLTCAHGLRADQHCVACGPDQRGQNAASTTPVVQDAPQEGAREWAKKNRPAFLQYAQRYQVTFEDYGEFAEAYAAHVCEERDKEIKRVEQQRNEHFAEIVRAREIIAGQIKRAETAEAALRAEREKEPPTRELVLVAMHRDFCRMRAALEPFVYPERWLKDGQCLHCGATETDDNCRIIHNSVCVVTEARTALQSGAEAAERAGQ